MDRRFVTVLGVSLVFALVVSAVFYQMTARSGPSKKVEQSDQKDLVVTTRPLGVGVMIKPADVKRLVAEYFGGIARQPAPPKVACDQRFNTGAQRASVKDDKATLPAVLLMYRVPATSHADTPALDLLGTILGSGEASRLNKVLAREAKLALGTQILLNPFGPRRGPSKSSSARENLSPITGVPSCH